MARLFGATERGVRLGRLAHLLISIGIAEPIEIEGPHIESRLIQRVSPRIAIESMGYGDSRRKGCAVHVKHRRSAASARVRCRQIPQEEVEGRVRARDEKMFFERVKLGKIRPH
jgi:hypothetical protein